MILSPQLKLLWQGDKVERWLNGGKVFPSLVEVSPTNICNAKCPWCFFSDRDNKVIDPEVLIRAIKEMAFCGIKAINWSGGGEPTLHPFFGKFVELSNECLLKQGLFTNGYREIPLQDKFEWIRISLTDRGFKPIVKPQVPFGICLNHTPDLSGSDIQELCKESKDFGAVYFQVRPALDVNGYTRLEPPNLEGYETDSFKVYTTPYKYEEAGKNRGYDRCYGFNFCISINANGEVGSCLYMMHDPSFVFGDLDKESLKSIIEKSPNVVDVSKDCQICCKNHEVNKLLYGAKNIKQIDFL